MGRNPPRGFEGMAPVEREALYWTLKAQSTAEKTPIDEPPRPVWPTCCRNQTADGKQASASTSRRGKATTPRFSPDIWQQRSGGKAPILKRLDFLRTYCLAGPFSTAAGVMPTGAIRTIAAMQAASVCTAATIRTAAAVSNAARHILVGGTIPSVAVPTLSVGTSPRIRVP